jgi:hypothetical protein
MGLDSVVPTDFPRVAIGLFEVEMPGLGKKIPREKHAIQPGV